MRRVLIVTFAATLSFLPLTAFAQTTPPTTLERNVAVTTVKQVDTNDDDSDKTGLWGLLGLLGLGGLAGLARKRKQDDYNRPPNIGNTAPPTSSGATSRTDRP